MGMMTARRLHERQKAEGAPPPPPPPPADVPYEQHLVAIGEVHEQYSAQIAELKAGVLGVAPDASLDELMAAFPARERLAAELDRHIAERLAGANHRIEELEAEIGALRSGKPAGEPPATEPEPLTEAELAEVEKLVADNSKAELEALADGIELPEGAKKADIATAIVVALRSGKPAAEPPAGS